MPLRRSLLMLLAAGAAVVLWWIAAPAPAHARDGGDRGERVEVEVGGRCGRSSDLRLRLRAERGVIRIDARVRTSRYGVWRLSVLHERRTVVNRVRVRATAAARGFERRTVVPDWAGADAVGVRAVAPGGETCTASATVPGPGS